MTTDTFKQVSTPQADSAQVLYGWLTFDQPAREIGGA
jgi:hypothetical protein